MEGHRTKKLEIYFTDRTLTGKLDEVPRSGDQTPKTRLIGVVGLARVAGKPVANFISPNAV
jgi:hypothetical protein